MESGLAFTSVTALCTSPRTTTPCQSASAAGWFEMYPASVRAVASAWPTTAGSGQETISWKSAAVTLGRLPRMAGRP